jgi:rod shape-determining protein MreB
VALDELKSDIWELSPLDFKDKILEEDACLARRKDNHKLLAIGTEALVMRGRLDSIAEIVFPFSRSRILDQEGAKVLLQELLKKVFKGAIFNPSVMVIIAVDATSLQRKLVSQLFYDLGFSRVDLIAKPLAAAIGAGIPVADASGTLFLQMGASEVSLSMIALGSILFHEESDCAGNFLNQRIVDHLVAKENFAISLETAETIKRQVFSFVDQAQANLVVAGKTVNGANPLELTIKTTDLEPIANFLKAEYQSLIDALFTKIPPNLMTDALQKGLLLSGGFAKLTGLEDFLSTQLTLPVALLDASDLLASIGATAVLKNLALFSNSFSFEV